MTFVKLKNQPVLNDNFNNALQNFFTPYSSLYRDDAAGDKKHFIPVNIKESNEQFSIEIIAPGFTKEDFTIKLDKNLLTIGAEKKDEVSSEEKVIRNEWNQVSFSRSFTINKQVDTDAISAEYVHGVLMVKLPKKAEVKTPAKQISVN